MQITKQSYGIIKETIRFWECASSQNEKTRRGTRGKGDEGIAVTTKDMNMPENLAHCIYNNVLDDYLRQVLDNFNQYLKDNERI